MLKSVVIDETTEVAPLMAEVAEAIVGLVTEVTDEKAVKTDDMVSAAVKIWVMSVVNMEWEEEMVKMYEMADTTDSWDCSRDEKYDSSVTIDGLEIPDQM